MFSVALGGGKRGRQEGKRQGQGEGGTERVVDAYFVRTMGVGCVRVFSDSSAAEGGGGDGMGKACSEAEQKRDGNAGS